MQRLEEVRNTKNNQSQGIMIKVYTRSVIYCYVGMLGLITRF